jgi:hypothetical protein
MRPERSERNSDDSTTSRLCICFVDHLPILFGDDAILGRRAAIAARLTVEGAQAFEQGVAEVGDQRTTVIVV